MNICIIPARGKSKRIPQKNIKFFCGKPIIAWSIQIAKDSKCFDKIIVSTDDLEIASLAKKYGAEVPFRRPKYLSNDFAPTVPVISHAINWQIKNNQKPLYVCCIYPTSVFASHYYINRGLRVLKKFNSRYTFSATNYSHPIQRSFKIKKNNKLKVLYPRHYKSRSQDLETSFHDAGQFYWGLADTWLQNKTVISKDSSPIVIPRNRVQDIDTIEDWEIAERIFKIKDKKKFLF